MLTCFYLCASASICGCNIRVAMKHRLSLLLARCIVLGSLVWSSQALAQDRLPLMELPLESMGAFRAVGPNWHIAGEVESDRETRWSLDAAPGSGILVNIPEEDANDNLFTTWEHGDIELELDFMMPKGSNSGIYLQGRYEVQLLDSWGVTHPTFGDCGGIYERWDDNRPEGRQGYEGQPPRINASRAPGLWQQYKIIFHAPRFDDDGNKIANARFVRVEHNGVVIHENVEVTGATRAAAFDDEQPMGPLMIQGDHGPVAFRNIRYKRYGQEPVRLADLRYRFVEGRFERLPDFAQSPPTMEDAVDGLTWNVGSNPDTFAVAFDGVLHVPTSGVHRFTLALDWITGDPHFQAQNIGGGVLLIDGQTALEHDGKHREATGQIDLDAGRYPFTLAYFKNRQWHAPMMALTVEGPDTPLRALNAPGSLPEPSSVGAILVAPEREPVVLRSFIEHGGTKRTHAVSVGDPSGIHYSIDAGQAALLYVWRGPFLDATPMWDSRGQDQLAMPQGSILTLSGSPSLAFLDDETTPWPDSVNHAAPYRFQGYDLDEAERPTFRYHLGEVAVHDQLVPSDEDRYLTRYLVLRAGQEHAPLWCRLAAGAEIRRLSGGYYAIDNRTYYVEIHETSDEEPILRTTAYGQELLVPVRFEGSEARLTYSIIW